MAPHIGQAPPFGQSQSDRDTFRLRLAVLRSFLCGNADDVIKIKLGCGIPGKRDKQHFFHFVEYEVLYYNNMPARDCHGKPWGFPGKPSPAPVGTRTRSDG
jgi:hypothetical protein